MLTMIGLGLDGVKGLTLEGLEVIKGSDVVLLEKYTNVFDVSTVSEELMGLIGKPVKIVDRSIVEEESEILNLAEMHNVVLLVSGDPLIATTHINLLISCQEKNIPWRVIHGVSIYSAAIGISGLHVYKFGPPVTLSFWSDNYRPTTPYQIIEENRSRGLHTLVLFDISQEGKGMDVQTAAELLLRMRDETGKDVLPDKVLIMSRIGRPDQKLVYTDLDTLISLNRDVVGEPPHVMIVPGKLHFREEEWLNLFVYPK